MNSTDMHTYDKIAVIAFVLETTLLAWRLETITLPQLQREVKE